MNSEFVTGDCVVAAHIYSSCPLCPSVCLLGSGWGHSDALSTLGEKKNSSCTTRRTTTKLAGLYQGTGCHH